MDQKQRFQQAQQLFLHARQLPPERQGAFLDENCPDPALRREVEELLRSDEPRDDDFLAARPTTQQPIQSSEIGRTIGSYRVLEKLGEGGFGTVYMAEQRQPVRRTVALK